MNVNIGYCRETSDIFAASVLSLCRTGLCDMVVCTDSTPHGRGFSYMRQFVREVSGSSISSTTSFVGDLPLFRLKPPVFRLDDELVDLILSRIGSNKISSRDYSRRVFQLTNITNVSLSNPLTRIADVEVSDEGEKTPEWLLPRFINTFSAADITQFQTKEMVLVPEWRDPSKGRDFEMVIRCLKVIFPKAMVTSTTVSADVWEVPPASSSFGVGTVRRAMQLATTKIIVGKQFEVNRQRISDFLSRNIDPKALREIRSSLLSISGHVDLPAGAVLSAGTKFVTKSHKTAIIDACSDFISVRIVDDYHFKRIQDSMNSESSRLLLCGALDSKGCEMLENIFAQCYLRPLDKRLHICYADISQSELMKIQETNSSVELPSGCWFDGNAFIDVSGSRSRLRPDIRELAESYIDLKNAQIDTYNKLVSDGNCVGGTTKTR